MHNSARTQPIGNFHSGGISPEGMEILAAEKSGGARRRRWLIAGLVALALLLAGAVETSIFYRNWTRTGVLPPRGGLYFAKKVELPVPIFRQGDPQWRADPLGPGLATIA